MKCSGIPDQCTGRENASGVNQGGTANNFFVPMDNRIEGVFYFSGSALAMRTRNARPYTYTCAECGLGVGKKEI